MPEKKEAAQHKESYYQAKILEWLKKNHPDAFIWKAQGGPYSNHNGIPDVIALIGGHMFGFEVKRPGGKPTKLQELAITQINAAGGTALVVTTVEQVKEAIEKWTVAKP